VKPTSAADTWVLDHTAITVPDLDQAVDFFSAVVGARELYRRRISAGAAPEDMRRLYNTHPDAGYDLAKLDIAGVPLEIFRYRSPDQRTDMPRNSDIGGGHLAFRVTDIEAAVSRVKAFPGTRVLGSVSRLPNDHPLAGRCWIYFLTPWGLQLELVSDTDRSTG
jgi:catechol 2,3-dioxygenase-like lactoylglutathione lyase family enzyme